jgi:flagellar biosynthesis protein FliR
VSAAELLLRGLRGGVAILTLTTLVGGLPRLVQLGLAAALGLWCGVLAAPDALGPLPAQLGPLVALGLREAALGAALGVMAALPLWLVALTGQLVELTASGRGGPGGRGGPLAALIGVLGAAIFVAIDGHVAVATAVVDSYGATPSAAAPPAGAVIAALGGLVPAAARLAAPWLVTAAVIELVLGAAARVAGRAMAPGLLAAAPPAAIMALSASVLGALAVGIAGAMRGMLGG